MNYVDPMFVKLCQVHGVNPVARKQAEDIIKSAEAREKNPPLNTILAEAASRCPWPCYVTKEVRVDVFSVEDSAHIFVLDIVASVAKESGVSIQDILSNRRSQKQVLARHCVMWLAKELTPHSYPFIGKHLGGRDHTTIMHGVRRVQKMIDGGNASLINFLAKVSQRLRGSNNEWLHSHIQRLL